MAFWIRQAEKEITEKLVAQDFEGDVRRRMEQDIGGVVENEIFSASNSNQKSVVNGDMLGDCWIFLAFSTSDILGNMFESHVVLCSSPMIFG